MKCFSKDHKKKFCPELLKRQAATNQPNTASGRSGRKRKLAILPPMKTLNMKKEETPLVKLEPLKEETPLVKEELKVRKQFINKSTK